MEKNKDAGTDTTVVGEYKYDNTRHQNTRSVGILGYKNNFRHRQWYGYLSYKLLRGRYKYIKRNIRVSFKF